MQHKSLFVAVLMGSLALASCMKNEESQSATDARNARTQEAKSQAAYNEAQGQAALIEANAQATLAQAQATIAAAEAKLKEAEAKRVEAEATKILAEAKLVEAETALKEVEAQLQLVKVQQEQERLKILQEQLKQEIEETKRVIAETEVAIMEAERAKQEIANQMELMAQQLEIAKARNELALLQAMDALENYIKGQEEADRQEMRNAVDAYLAVVEEKMDAEFDYQQNLIWITMLQGALTSPEEVFAVQLADKRAELARIEKKIAAIQKYAKVSPEEIEAYLDDARIALMDAENVYQAALQDRSDKWDAFNAAQNVNTEYTNDWWMKFEAFVENHTFVYDRWNEETETWEWGYQNDDAEFVALWNYENVNAEGVMYPEIKDGVIPTASITVWNQTFIPAKVQTANIKVRLAEIVADKEEEVADAKEVLLENYTAQKENIEGDIEFYTNRVAAYQEYVDAVSPKIEAAEALIEEKQEAYEDAILARNNAATAYNNYLAAHYNADAAEENQKYQEYQAAVQARIDAENAVIIADNNLTDAKNEVTWLTDQKYQKDLAAAQALNDKNVKEKAVTDAIKKAVTDAEKALSDQEAVVATKKTAYDAAVTARKAADVKLAADPTNETLIKAQADAAEAETAALTAYNTENGKLPDLQTAVNDAVAAFDAVNNPYLAAVEALEWANEQADDAAFLLEAAQEDVTEAETALALANEAVEFAKAAEEEAEEAWKEAQEAFDDTNEERIALLNAYWDAVAEQNAANNEWNDAQNALNDLKNTYYYYDNYVNQLNPEYFYGAAWYLVDYAGQLVNLEVNYEANVAAKDQELADLQAEVAEVEKNLDALDAIEAPYVKIVEAKAAAWTAYQEARKVVFDAEQARDAAHAEVEGMASTFYYWDDDNNLVEAASVAEALEDLYELKADLEEEIDALLKGDIPTMFGPDLQSAINELQVENEFLALRIELLTQLVDQYWAIVSELLGINPAA